MNHRSWLRRVCLWSPADLCSARPIQPSITTFSLRITLSPSQLFPCPPPSPLTLDAPPPPSLPFHFSLFTLTFSYFLSSFPLLSLLFLPFLSHSPFTVSTFLATRLTSFISLLPLKFFPLSTPYNFYFSFLSFCTPLSHPYVLTSSPLSALVTPFPFHLCLFSLFSFTFFPFSLSFTVSISLTSLPPTTSFMLTFTLPPLLPFITPPFQPSLTSPLPAL